MHTHFVIPLALVLALAGCNSSSRNATGNSVPAAAAKANPNAAILAAAEPFEALTEQAPTADWPKVDALIADARQSAATVRSRLTTDSGARIDRLLADIAAARRVQDRPGIALAAVESYRAIVEAQDARTAQPPIPVSLLDYAGFRYQALVRSPTVDWPQVAQSAAFARAQWAALKPQIKSAALTGVVDQAVSAMEDAARRKDAAFAESAAATELALVDLLEEQVAKP